MSTETPIPARTYGLVAILPDMTALARALEELLLEGVPPAALSVIGKDGASGGDSADSLAESLDPPVVDELLGGLLGGYVGLITGAALLLVPGIGPVVIAGGVAAVVAEGIASAAAGAGIGTLLGAIFDEGHVEAHRERYHQALADGRFMLAVHGTEEEYVRAEACLMRQPIVHLDRSLPPDAD